MFELFSTQLDSVAFANDLKKNVESFMALDFQFCTLLDVDMQGSVFEILFLEKVYICDKKLPLLRDAISEDV